MIWQFKYLIVAILFDILFYLTGIVTAFSIGILICMIIDYKNVREQLNNAKRRSSE